MKDRGEERVAVPSYRGVMAWQKAMDLAVNVYDASRNWPKEELYGLTSQLRRAAVSIPANVAEGKGRGGNAEYPRYLGIAYGSLCELETHLYLAQRLAYIDSQLLKQLLAQTTEVARLLHGLMKSQRAQPARGPSSPLTPNA
ncbi:MAG: four helix bundle protein [Thermomicrobiales bacterium]